MTILSAFRNGARRVNAAGAVLASVFLLTVVAALPLALVLQQTIAASLGASESAGAAAGGVNYTWWQQFSSQAAGLGRTFSPAIVGGAAVLENASAMLDNRPHEVSVAAAGAVYMLAWLFLAGGILDRYARNRPVGGSAFFAACGTYFVRFARLGVAAGIVYVALFAGVHTWLFGSVYPDAVRDLTVEWHAIAVRVALYLLFGIVLCLCNLLFDYAKVRAVVEDRRSMLGALVASARFVWRRPGAFALYLLDAGCFVLVAAVYIAIAPSARLPVWWTLLAGQAYLLLRLWVKLLFWSSEIAFFEQAFAHADYVAAPLPVWPDSPAAEAIVRGS